MPLVPPVITVTLPSSMPIDVSPSSLPVWGKSQARHSFKHASQGGEASPADQA
jgi:hypothetical protein